MNRNMGEAIALTGFAVWQLTSTYTDMVPTIGELRQQVSDSTDARQRLRDADVCVGGVALIAGCAATWLSGSWVPLGLVLGSLLWVSFYHHLALGGPTPTQLDGGSGSDE